MVFEELAKTLAQEVITGLLLLGIRDPESLGERSLAQVLNVGVEGSDGHCLPGVVTKETKSLSQEGVNDL